MWEAIKGAWVAIFDFLKTAPKALQVFVLLALFGFCYIPLAKWAELWPFTVGTKRVSVGELVQFQMWEAHSGETPSKDETMIDDARGSIRIRVYDSDFAMQVIRKSPGARTVSVWFPAPKPLSEVTEQEPFSLGASAVWAGGGPGYQEARRHGPADKVWREATGEPGVWREWYFWRDDCAGFMVFYEATNSYQIADDGYPAFFWTKYQH